MRCNTKERQKSRNLNKVIRHAMVKVNKKNKEETTDSEVMDYNLFL